MKVRVSIRSASVFGGMLSALLGALPAPAVGQLPDLLDVSAQYIPSAALDDPRPTTTQLSSYDGSLNLPIPLGSSTFLIPGAAYHVEAVSFDQAPPGFVEPPRAYHSIEVPVLFVQLLPDDWSLSLRLAPGLAADHLALDDHLLRVSGLAMVTHTFSERLVAGVGGLVSYTFGSFLPLPALYLDYRPAKGWQIETFLPAFLRIAYTFGDRLEVGVRAEVNGNAYGIRDRSIAEVYPCVAAAADDPSTAEDETEPEPGACFDHVAYSLAAAGAVVGLRTVGNVWVTAFLGHSLYRRFDTLNIDDEPIPVAGGGETLPNQLMFRLAVTWRIPQG